MGLWGQDKFARLLSVPLRSVTADGPGAVGNIDLSVSPADFGKAGAWLVRGEPPLSHAQIRGDVPG